MIRRLLTAVRRAIRRWRLNRGLRALIASAPPWHEDDTGPTLTPPESDPPSGPTDP